MTKQEFIESANYYINTRRWSIFPVARNKRPLVEWKEYQTRFATPEEIEQWSNLPDVQIGAATGSLSNITVIDIENGGSIDGLAQTLIAKTGSGGFHFFYKYKKGIRNKARFRELADIRSEGGYCFTAGHKIIKRANSHFARYSKDFKGYNILCDIDKIEKDDILMAYDERNGKIVETTVKETSSRIVNETCLIKFGNRNGALRLTPEHPIFTIKGWKMAKDIKEGDELFHVSREDVNLQPQAYKASKGTNPRKGGCKKETYIQKIPSHYSKERMSGYEKFVLSIARDEQLPLEWTGNGTVIIKSEGFWLHPDFIIPGTKKIIEVSIDYFKKGLNKFPKTNLSTKTNKERIELYKKAGYECLFIEADEWMNGYDENTLIIIDSLRKRIREFIGNGLEVKFVSRIIDEVEVYNIHCEPYNNYFVKRLNKGGQYILAHNCMISPSWNENGPYSWIKDSEIVDLPEGLIPEEKNLYPVNNYNNYSVSDYFNNHQFCKSIDELPTWDGISNDARNQTLASYIGKILPLVHPSDWETIGWEAARIANANTKDKIPMTEHELRTVFNSIKSRERSKPSFRKSRIENNEPEIKDIEDEVLPLLEVVKKHQERKKGINFYKFGFESFEETMGGGTKEGDLIIITGKSGHGKTLLAQNFTTNFIEKNNEGVLFFSYEVLIEYIWEKFSKMGVKEDNIIFSPFTTASGSLDWIEKKIIEGINKYGIKMAVIDHLGFLLPKKQKYDNSSQQNYSLYLGGICRDLKNFAIKNRIVIVLLTHVNKTAKGEGATGENIAWSAGIKQESDFVFVIERVEANDSSKKSIYKLEELNDNENIFTEESKITLDKNRMTGLCFRKRFKCVNDKFIVL